MESKLVKYESVPTLGENLRKAGKRIISTNGCFDILHWGHLQYLQEARALGDVLVVAINSDDSVRALKGPSRPVFSETIRAAQLSALQCVDHVVVFPEDTPVELLDQLRPAIHVKGGDYQVSELPETAVVEGHGGEVRCLSLADGYSTSNLIEKLKLLPDEETSA